jgi:hypothetical protein
MKKLICSLILASSGLFITALVPTKADAVSLTLTPVGTLERKPGDLIAFTASVNPMGSTIWFLGWNLFYSDSDELALANSSRLFPSNTRISDTEVVLRFVFRVLEGVRKDGTSDFGPLIATYEEYDPTVLGERVRKRVESEPHILDVVPEPVPEPTTIFGSAIALSLGGWLKRKKLSRQNNTVAQR